MEGADYYFISRRESEDLILGGHAADWEILYGHTYGISRKEFSEKTTGSTAIAVVSPSGAKRLANLATPCHYFYINVNKDTAIKRFLDRMLKEVATNSLVAVDTIYYAKRLEAALGDIEDWPYLMPSFTYSFTSTDTNDILPFLLESIDSIESTRHD